MEDHETSPLIKLIEEHRPELALRMIAVNVPAELMANMPPAEREAGIGYMNRVLNTVISWLRDYSLVKDGVLVAIEYEAIAGDTASPEELIARVDRTLAVIGDYATEQFGPGKLADTAVRQMNAASAVARLVIAQEVMQRVNK